MLFTLLQYNPAMYLFTDNKNNPLEILREDYSFIKEEGYEGLDKDNMLPFNPVDSTQMFTELDKYLKEHDLVSVPVTGIGPHAEAFNYSTPKIWFADELCVQYPTYGTVDDIRKYSNMAPDMFKLALESAMDLAFKNYVDGAMGPIHSTLYECKGPEKLDQNDILGYILLPVKVRKTPILSFSETREENQDTAGGLHTS